MSIFSNKFYDFHERVIFYSDKETGLRAIIAIHNTFRGGALGGCRFWNYETEEDALSDVLRLSRGMTYKAAMAGLHSGGGKAVIIGDSRKIKTPELLQAFGRCVEQLNGAFRTGEDVGISREDVVEMRKMTKHVKGVDGGSDPSVMTANGVFYGIQACLKFETGSIDLTGHHVAIQGVGSVGRKLAKLLYEAGAKLTITDIYSVNIADTLKDIEATVVLPDEIFEVEADVFSPCALGAIINENTLNHLKCQIIAGSANNQLATVIYGEELRKRGILYAPDYVINAGGLISVFNEGPVYNYEGALAQTREIYNTLLEIFETAENQGMSTNHVSDIIAERRLH